jgi:hypothetical protein
VQLLKSNCIDLLASILEEKSRLREFDGCERFLAKKGQELAQVIQVFLQSLKRYFLK